jgi:hypothetical protein
VQGQSCAAASGVRGGGRRRHGVGAGGGARRLGLVLGRVCGTYDATHRSSSVSVRISGWIVFVHFSSVVFHQFHIFQMKLSRIPSTSTLLCLCVRSHSPPLHIMFLSWSNLSNSHFVKNSCEEIYPL